MHWRFGTCGRARCGIDAIVGPAITKSCVTLAPREPTGGRGSTHATIQRHTDDERSVRWLGCERVPRRR
jgi:hypothetical protein